MCCSPMQPDGHISQQESWLRPQTLWAHLRGPLGPQQDGFLVLEPTPKWGRGHELFGWEETGNSS